MKGRGGVGVPFINPPTRGNTAAATLFTLGVDAGKSLVMSRLAIDEEGPGFVHYPRAECFGEVFFQQLTAEKFERTFEKGVIKSAWIKIRERNEALDCAVYATAALEIINPNFDYLREFYQKSQRSDSTPPKRRGTLSRGVEI